MWKLKSGSTIEWSADTQAGNGNSGVAQIVKSTAGAIGYVDLPDAKASGLKYASVKNQAGKYVEPTIQSTQAAGDGIEVKDDLTFDQIRPISESAPPFRKLWLSGGEPTLREELGEIVGLFSRNNGIRNVNLPTNGLLPDKVFRAVDRMLEVAPQAAIDLNFSLDGLANTHDAIRGVPNNFERTIATLAEAERRYKGNRRVRRNVVTVITRENYDEIVRLGARRATLVLRELPHLAHRQKLAHPRRRGGQVGERPA